MTSLRFSNLSPPQSKCQSYHKTVHMEDIIKRLVYITQNQLKTFTPFISPIMCGDRRLENRVKDVLVCMLCFTSISILLIQSINELR